MTARRRPLFWGPFLTGLTFTAVASTVTALVVSWLWTSVAVWLALTVAIPCGFFIALMLLASFAALYTPARTDKRAREQEQEGQ